MRRIVVAAALSVAMIVSLLLVVAASPQTETAAPTATSTGTFSNCLAPPSLTSTAATQVPTDMALPRSADANCFAWRQFIALNWVASSTMRGAPDTSVPPSDFGKRNDRRQVVWETLKESDEVFLTNAQVPTAWNSWPSKSRIKVLGGMKSEVDPQPVLDLSDVGQASQGHPWLTAQNKHLTLYERRMNQDEFNYIVNNQLYNASIQQQFVQNPGLSLPDATPTSTAFGPTGAIETKAAWIELDNPQDWPRFKTSKAIVRYPGSSGSKEVVVGLVGLHIIHKTALGQQFIWATFEHVDNCPDKDQVENKTLQKKYTYFNPRCNPKTDHYKCQANANPVKAGNPPNPYNAPIQVVRETPVPSRPNNNVLGLNQAVWNLIRQANPQSVYLNYQLVNTLWAQQNTVIPAGAHVPLTDGNAQPPVTQEPVSNAMLETYVQGLNCLSCHASAPVAQLQQPATTKVFDPAIAGTPATSTNAFAADYSFLFDNAQQSSANKSNH